MGATQQGAATIITTVVLPGLPHVSRVPDDVIGGASPRGCAVTGCRYEPTRSPMSDTAGSGTIIIASLHKYSTAV